MTKKTRTEKDALGTIQVPQEAYYGSFTVRAQENFQISGLTAPSIFAITLGLVKKSAALANMKLGTLDKKIGKAIVQASEEFIEGKFDNEFTLDVFQAGAGTPYNMNANEIISNRAGEILGDSKGSYQKVHPNNHVNMAQSTNDVIPTTTRIAALFSLIELLQELNQLELSFKKLAKTHKDIIKVGRTHLEDAVPISLGQEFLAYADALHKDSEHIQLTSTQLQELGIGGTALGTGINTHPQYQKTVVKILSELTGIELKPAPNMVEAANNYNLFGNVSSSLRALALTLIRIANDLKLMNMGPKAGIKEITLPEVEPGSSIMPGKVNPSIAECIEMIGCQIIGNDAAIMMGIRGGQLELNVNGPVIMHNLLQSIELLTNGCNMFRKFCVDHIEVNKARIKKMFDESLCTGTALNPYLGYQVTAEIINEAVKKGKSIEEVVRSHKLMDDKTLAKVLSVKATTTPQIADQKLISKIQKSKEYLAYRKQIGK